ncbi:MAG TPA: hypothetical protein VG936_07725 [Lacunisphaera sp.]|nr:hypothetical protein [Lacunisphaera sp.]
MAETLAYRVRQQRVRATDRNQYMNITGTIELVLAFGAGVAALAVMAIAVIGLIVWLAGGRLGARNDREIL